MATGEPIVTERGFRLPTELDAHASAALFDPVLTYVERCAGSATIDCEDLDFIDSSGLRLLVDVALRSEATIVLANLSPHARRLFERTQVDTLFEYR
jgi:anti-anti-sigma factor